MLQSRCVDDVGRGDSCELDEATSKDDPTCSLSEAVPDIGIVVERVLEAISMRISSVSSGVSFRFGGYCHVNVGSIATYWGWLLAFGALACLLQFATFGYCIKVYLTNILHVRQDPSQTDSLTGSSRSRTARATARRVYQALSLQWRSLAIVTVAIATTALVCVVFIVIDDQLTQKAFAETDTLIPWIVCLISSQDKEQCLQYTGPILLPEGLAVATLFVLGFVGVEAFLLLSRLDLFKAWVAFVWRPRTEKS